MCVILIGRVNQDVLRSAQLQNPDGCSLYNNKLGLIKNPNWRELTSSTNEFTIYHFRIGTSGSIDTYNIHPFIICNGAYYLYHNGILGDGEKRMSDTHSLANLLKDASLDTAKSVLSALASNNKFIIASTKDANEYYLFGNWQFSGGVLYSHKLYY